jgi:selenocysteine lyase/cysteine desulfurase
MPYTAEHARRCRADFPALTKQRDGIELAFLDGPGGSQVPAAVIEAIADFYATCNVNTHGNFPPSREVDRRMHDARTVVAAFLNAPSADCISFGQNMTTLNFALSHAIGRTLKAGDEVLITELDHEANRGPWLALKEHGIVVREVRLEESGVLDAADMAAKISARTKLFALGASSNALGTVNDIALARRLTRAVDALLVIDAVHYAPHFPLDVRAMDAARTWASCTRSPALSSACRPIGCGYRTRRRRIASRPARSIIPPFTGCVRRSSISRASGRGPACASASSMR